MILAIHAEKNMTESQFSGRSLAQFLLCSNQQLLSTRHTNVTELCLRMCSLPFTSGIWDLPTRKTIKTRPRELRLKRERIYCTATTDAFIFEVMCLCLLKICGCVKFSRCQLHQHVRNNSWSWLMFGFFFLLKENKMWNFLKHIWRLSRLLIPVAGRESLQSLFRCREYVLFNNKAIIIKRLLLLDIEKFTFNDVFFSVWRLISFARSLVFLCLFNGLRSDCSMKKRKKNWFEF